MKPSAQIQNTMNQLHERCLKACQWITELKMNDEYVLLRKELEEIKKLLK